MTKVAPVFSGPASAPSIAPEVLSRVGLAIEKATEAAQINFGLFDYSFGFANRTSKPFVVRDYRKQGSDEVFASDNQGFARGFYNELCRSFIAEAAVTEFLTAQAQAKG